MRELLLGGFGGQVLVVAFDVGEVQAIELRVQSRQVTRGHGASIVDIEVGGRDVDVEQIVATGEL